MRSFLVMLLFTSLFTQNGGRLINYASSTRITQQDQDGIKKLLSLSLEDLMGLKISIATGSEQYLTKAPAIASVITAKQIEDMGASNIDEVLETVPGLHVARNYRSYGQVYTFRGIYQLFNPQILMLRDGIPVTSIFLGDRQKEWGVSINMVDRIEVIRGPGSALYGADAFAGVINIITKSPGKAKKDLVGFSLGAFNSFSAYGNFDFSLNKTKANFMIKYFDTDGHKEVIDKDNQTALDNLYGTNVSNAPGSVSLSRRILESRLNIDHGFFNLKTGMRLRSNVGSGAGIAKALESDSRYTHDSYDINLMYSNGNLSNDLGIETFISYSEKNFQNENNLVLYPKGANLGFGVLPDGLIGNPEIWERAYRVQTILDYTKSKEHHLKFGFGVTRSELYKVQESKNFGPDPKTGLPLPLGSPLVDVSDTPYTFMPEGGQTNQFIFVQDIWKINNAFEFTSGVRYDYYSDFGGTTNPRFALVYSPNKDYSAKLIFGKAFRSPSFVELFAINNPSAIGNPNIKPEKLTSYEIATSFIPTQRLQMSVNLFKYKWDNIILFLDDDTRPELDIAQNFGIQEAVGFEIEGILQLKQNVVLKGNYSYQDSENKRTHTMSSNAPRQQFYSSINWRINAEMNFFTKFNWVADRKRDSDDSRPSIPDYHYIDFSFRFNVSESLNLYIKGYNIFDQDRREPAKDIPNDLPLEGRNYTIETKYEF